MRGLPWVGWVLLLAACTRENGAFDGDAGGSAGEEGASRTDGGDDPVPSTGSASGSASGSGVDGTTTGAPPSTSGSTSESTTTPVEGTTPGGGEEGPSTGEPQDCCVPTTAPGCSSSVDLESEVCLVRPECCAVAWDQQCVELVALLGFDGCGVSTDACCSIGNAGCELAYVEQCVCGLDPSCCGIAWHPYCIFLASDQCHAPCEPPSNCCFPHLGPGCDIRELEGCVCAVMGGCCDSNWSDGCANQAVECNASACGG